LGNGTFTSTNTPQPVQANATWQAVAAGWKHTVALRTDGTLWAWGDNFLGQLGIGTSSGLFNTPQPVQTNVTWQAIAAGRDFTLAVRTDGTLWGWGWNLFGQIGQPVPWLPYPVLGGAVWGAP
jgi:alpha-tubulin suppressor-like RCC1 family protein